MNPDVKALWLAGLRDPNAKQTRGSLTDDDGSCCLGVLCEIAVANGVIPPPEIHEPDRRNFRRYAGRATYLPEEVIVWAGLVPDGGIWIDKEDPMVTMPNGQKMRLSGLNDEERMSFTEIADIIEEQL